MRCLQYQWKTAAAGGKLFRLEGKQGEKIMRHDMFSLCWSEEASCIVEIPPHRVRGADERESVHHLEHHLGRSGNEFQRPPTSSQGSCPMTSQAHRCIVWCAGQWRFDPESMPGTFGTYIQVRFPQCKTSHVYAKNPHRTIGYFISELLKSPCDRCCLATNAPHASVFGIKNKMPPKIPWPWR